MRKHIITRDNVKFYVVPSNGFEIAADWGDGLKPIGRAVRSGEFAPRISVTGFDAEAFNRCNVETLNAVADKALATLIKEGWE